MSECPKDLHYSESHEWVRPEGDVAVVGITDFAQAQMGDLVFVELPEVGDELTVGSEAGVVESVKTASDFYSPVSGEVVAVNEELNSQPELVNQQPYTDGWLFKVKMNDAGTVSSLMDAAIYNEKFVDA